MPNHHEKNRKPLQPPNDPGLIIGYTGDLNDCPTIYFTTGHYTQRHPEEWNVGWENCKHWQCLYFANVLRTDKHSSHKNTMSKSAYLTKLQNLGRNDRVQGKDPEQLASWNLKMLGDENNSYQLREFWIKNPGNQPDERFPHKSRNEFTPVPQSSKDLPKLKTQLGNLKSATHFETKLVPVKGGPDEYQVFAFRVAAPKPVAPAASSSRVQAT